MASQTQGIQQLLAAEKRADEKVAQARKRKKFEDLCFILCSQGHFNNLYLKCNATFKLNCPLQRY